MAVRSLSTLRGRVTPLDSWRSQHLHFSVEQKPLTFEGLKKAKKNHKCEHWTVHICLSKFNCIEPAHQRNQLKKCYVLFVMQGYLMKKGRENNQFLPRKFVLSEIDNTIKYYVKVNKWCSIYISHSHKNQRIERTQKQWSRFPTSMWPSVLQRSPFQTPSKLTTWRWT